MFFFLNLVAACVWVAMLRKRYVCVCVCVCVCDFVVERGVCVGGDVAEEVCVCVCVCVCV